MALDLNPSALPPGITRYEDVVNAPKVTDEQMGQQAVPNTLHRAAKDAKPTGPR